MISLKPLLSLSIITITLPLSHTPCKQVPYHPLNSWVGMPGGGSGRNGFTHGRQFGVFVYDMKGLRAPPSSLSEAEEEDVGGNGGGDSGGGGTAADERRSSYDGSRIAPVMGSHDVREVVGRFITVTFEIVDQRPPTQKRERGDGGGVGGEATAGGEEDDDGPPRKYTVTVSEGSNAVSPLAQVEYSSPGTYTIEVELDGPRLANLVVLVVNEHGQACQTSLTVSYNRHYYRYLKWVATLPLFLVGIPLLLTPERRWNSGPSSGSGDSSSSGDMRGTELPS